VKLPLVVDVAIVDVRQVVYAQLVDGQGQGSTSKVKVRKLCSYCVNTNLFTCLSKSVKPDISLSCFPLFCLFLFFLSFFLSFFLQLIIA
jgi:hypothetical protein